MGLTNHSVGHGAVDNGLEIKRSCAEERVVALAGNPNVGKSTVFNALTGMHQHTGNWPGKTVAGAQGICTENGRVYRLVDIPGTYSLMAHSVEEGVARDFLCFEENDAVIVVCDATCLERGLGLVLQTLEVTARVVVCVNLLDEAKRKQIRVDLPLLSQRLGVPVIGVIAQHKKTLNGLMSAVESVIGREPFLSVPVCYPAAVEKAIAQVASAVASCDTSVNARWMALRLLEQDPSIIGELRFRKPAVCENDTVKAAVKNGREQLQAEGITEDALRDTVARCVMTTAEALCAGVVRRQSSGYHKTDRRLDRLFTGRLTGYPVMLLLLAFIFWLTIEGANYPSQWLASGLFWLQDRLTDLCILWSVPPWLHGALVLGAYRVLAWVVSVMLPPMAIFFPLFTLLEDMGYLPRVAYNLDRPFKRCRACGKQALTMCMGFGCNAAGVVGCRIIDSPRERLLAILTNNFVPCNGRFPTLVAILTMFFVGAASGVSSSFRAALLLTAVIVCGVGATFLATALLSRTLLKGTPSAFTLELPPYRKPQVGKVLVRSVRDRTVFVLGRAAAVAAPAGLILWVMANVTVNGTSLLAHGAAFLDPFGHLLGLDGTILMAFIMGFPANEIVIPIILMIYMANGTLTDYSSLSQLHTLLLDNGWTWVTAVCTMVFSLMHWPCSTTLLTIRKETGSALWTMLAALIPTAAGMVCCFLINTIAHLFGA